MSTTDPRVAPADEVTDRQCQPINDDIGIHFWPFLDPPIGTACKCGEATRRPPRWHRVPDGPS